MHLLILEPEHESTLAQNDLQMVSQFPSRSPWSKWDLSALALIEISWHALGSSLGMWHTVVVFVLFNFFVGFGVAVLAVTAGVKTIVVCVGPGPRVPFNVGLSVGLAT